MPIVEEVVVGSTKSESKQTTFSRCQLEVSFCICLGVFFFTVIDKARPHSFVFLAGKIALLPLVIKNRDRGLFRVLASELKAKKGMEDCFMNLTNSLGAGLFLEIWNCSIVHDLFPSISVVYHNSFFSCFLKNVLDFPFLFSGKPFRAEAGGPNFPYYAAG